MSDITRVQAWFALDTMPAERLRQVATAVATSSTNGRSSSADFLALTTGLGTTREHVHGARAVWTREIRPDHRSPIPFGESRRRCRRSMSSTSPPSTAPPER